MARRQLDVTADTTLDRVEAAAEGPGWTAESLGVVDVDSPGERAVVRLGVELDPGASEELEPHADFAVLTPEQARMLAADLEAIADAAEAGERVSSGRG